MEIIDKLASNHTSKIGMLPSASKYISIKFSDQWINILNDKEWLNGLKCRTKMQKRESLFKYQARIYNVQGNYDANHRGVQIIWNNKPFPYLDVINGKTYP